MNWISLSSESPGVIRDENGVPVEWSDGSDKSDNRGNQAAGAVVGFLKKIKKSA